MDVILQGIVGSTAYGLATEQSDIDRLGVFQAPTEELLGLHADAAITSHVRHDPDVTHHELTKFARLALGGNPTVLELLFLTGYEICEPVGAQLVAARSAFLSTDRVRAAYGGYAISQAHRLLKRNQSGLTGFASARAKRTAKHGRHCFRLLLLGHQLLTTGGMVLDLSAHRDDLFAIGELAATDPTAFTARFEAEMARLESVASVLPDKPDVDRIEALVRDARLARLAVPAAA